jgi:hypothetical protein
MDILFCSGERFLPVCLLFTMMAPMVSSQTPEYFQQEVNYEITVTLDDRNHELHASERIEYINNSDDQLGFLYFHLWPNAYSSNTTDLAEQLMRIYGKQKMFRNDRLRGFIDSLDFRVNGIHAQWEVLPEQPDICRISLPCILEPGDTIIISTPFRVKIPEGNISRMGFNRGTYQVSQWYPKPAVYDNNGWHQMPYLDQGEFYSEFGSFDVKITLPSAYIVAASGELLTGSEIEWLNEIKTLHYSGRQIHDFAWVAGKDFFVIKGKTILPSSGSEVTTMVMFTSQAYLWYDAIEYVNNSILKFSEWIGDYPYKSFTAVQADIAAGSGMEYPGLTVVGHAADAWSLEEVIVHEVAHSWFYSSIASDERSYPFMDEGLASSYEARYMELVHPGRKLWEVYFMNRNLARFLQIDNLPVGRMAELEWLVAARNNLEQPVDIAAPEYTENNYSDIIYFKAAQGFNMLRNYLGNSLFDTIMHDYYAGWKSKHPYPSGLREAFEDNSDKDLNWFFSGFIGTTKRTDYKALRLEDNRLLVKNTGELPSSFPVSGISGDSTVFEIWSDGFTGKNWLQLPDIDHSRIMINKDHLVPEINHLNNNIRNRGIFRRRDPVQLQLLPSVEDPDRRSLILMPLMNWNRTDGFMAGIALKNNFILPKTIEYFAMPFYTFNDPGIAGKGRISFNLIPYDKLVRKASLTLEGAKFGAPGPDNYHLIGTGLNVNFRNIRMISAENHRVYGRFLTASDLTGIEEPENTAAISFWQSGYVFERSSLVNPLSFIATIESNGSYYKSSLEFNYEYSYNGRGNGMQARLFAGVMLKEDPVRKIYSFSSSGRSGRELYMFQGDFPDRFAVFPSTFWSRQMVLSEGGLVTPVKDSTRYSPWLISASLVSSLPGKAAMVPVKPFLNILYRGNGDTHLFLESGLKAGIWGLFEIYFPMLVTENLNSGPVKERIRFIFSLETLYKLRLR